VKQKFKKSLVLLFITSINFVLLFLSYSFSFDEITEKTICSFDFIFIFLLYAFISFLILIFSLIISFKFLKNQFTKSIKISILLCVSFSAFFYYNNLSKTITNLKNKEIIDRILAKQKNYHYLEVSYKFENLDFEEYSFLSSKIGIEKISNSAYDITISSTYDCFQGDHQFSLIYKIPLDENVKEFYDYKEYHYENYRKTTVFEMYIKVEVMSSSQ